MLGFAGSAAPFIEQGIVASVQGMGMLIAAAYKLPLAFSAGLVALFAVFHGYAHGAEVAVGGAALTYSLGFALATAFLHGCGMALGTGVKTLNYAMLDRFAGAAIALDGVYLAVT